MTDEEADLEVFLAAARMCAAGHISFEYFRGITALAMLKEAGIPNPTPEQFNAKLVELQLAEAMIGPAPEK